MKDDIPSPFNRGNSFGENNEYSLNNENESERNSNELYNENQEGFSKSTFREKLLDPEDPDQKVISTNFNQDEYLEKFFKKIDDLNEKNIEFILCVSGEAFSKNLKKNKINESN